jgi:hypothetical protein
MATSGNVARLAVKVHAFRLAPAVWTASGSVYVIEDVETALNELEAELDREGPNPVKRAFFDPDEAMIRQKIGGAIHKAVKSCYDLALPHGPGTGIAGRHAFASDFLVLGWANQKPYFLEFAHDGQMNWHTHEGFYAVGSAGDFATVANALMAHYIEGEPLAVEDGLLLAWRTIDTTCGVSSHFVGGPVQIAVVDSDRQRVLDEAEIEEVKTAVAGWKEVERDSIRRRKTPEPEGPDRLPEVIPDDAQGAAPGTPNPAH